VTWERLAAAWPLLRDIVIVATALGLLVYEVRWGGARQQVLIAATGLLVSPVFLRRDEKDQPEPKPGEADR
jgi:hypothetical protein